MISLRRLGLAALVALATAACEDDDGVVVTPDAGADGGATFLDPCQADDQCATGHCGAFGAEKRCTVACEGVRSCPRLTGWSCTAGRCACSPGAKTDKCATDGDCDGQPDRPQTAEVCNGKDDDCNRKVDDVAAGADGATAYYVDRDDDGFGDVYSKTWMCASEPGWVTDPSDCDDDNDRVNIDEKEVCGDALDNDCDGDLEDRDVCGLAPITVPDAAGNQYASAVLGVCSSDSEIGDTVDITELVGKQDAEKIKFTVRLAGSPAISGCASYKLAFGDPAQADDALVYIYRLPANCNGLPTLQVFYQGSVISSTVVPGFNAAAPGHVSYLIEKRELFDRVPWPSYRLRACTQTVSGAEDPPTACGADTCETPVHR